MALRESVPVIAKAKLANVSIMDKARTMEISKKFKPSLRRKFEDLRLRPQQIQQEL